MSARRGFSVIELIIVIVIMGILSTLAVAGLRNTRIQSRDDDVKASAENVARGLENYYKTGNPTYNIAPGKYPSIQETVHAAGWEVADIGPRVEKGYTNTWLNGVTGASISKFGVIAITPFDINNQATIASMVPIGSIRYLPLMYSTADFYGPDRYTMCMGKSDICTNFRLYYKTEIDNQLHMIASKRQ